MVKRILAVCLALVISCTVAIKPLNVEAAAESGILGGALAAMGVSLSVPQIALLVAAAGGAVYLYENREAVADSLETFLEVATQGIEEKKQQLQDWWNAAKLGHVAISTAQDWIGGAVKEWIAGLYDGSTAPVVPAPDGTFKDYPIYPNGTRWLNTYERIYFGIGDKEYIQVNGYTHGIYRFYQYSGSTVYTTAVLWLYNHSNMSYVFKVGDSSVKAETMYNNNYTMDHGIAQQATIDISIPSNKKLFEQWKNGAYLYTASSIRTAAQWLSYARGSTSYNTSLDTEKSLESTSIGGISLIIADGYSMDDIYFDDLEFVGTGYITADTTKTGEAVFEESITNTLTGMQAGTITWTDYVTDVSTAPTVTVPDATDQTITNDFVIGNTGVTDTVVTPAVDPPELENYKVQLKDFFPFCLPFDIVAFIGVLAAEPEAPKMDFTLPWIDGDGFTFTIDLSKWDPVAEILRTMELLALIVGLGFKTREMIRG